MRRVLAAVALATLLAAGGVAAPEAAPPPPAAAPSTPESSWIVGTWKAEAESGSMELRLDPGGAFRLVVRRHAEERTLEGTWKFGPGSLELTPAGAERGEKHGILRSEDGDTLRLAGPLSGGNEVQLRRISVPDPAGSATSPPPGLFGRWEWSEAGSSFALEIEADGELREELVSEGYSMTDRKRWTYEPGKLVLIAVGAEFLGTEESPFTLSGDTLEIEIEYAHWTLVRAKR